MSQKGKMLYFNLLAIQDEGAPIVLHFTPYLKFYHVSSLM